jgi:hypothetical protein
VKFLHKHILTIIAVFAVFGVLASTDSVNAQTAAEKPAAKPAKTNAAFAEIADVPGLPRVLLIGDSISMGYTAPVREALAGKANVHRPPENCGPTIRGVENLDAWLGEGPWNVIHFNFGLHDLRYIEEKPQVSLADYEKNLRTIVQRLKQTGAKLIWCSTTPVPKKSSPPRHNQDVLAYNAVAKKVMEENGIPIDDLYMFALPQLEKIQRANNVHFTDKGSKILASQVSKVLLDSLPAEKPSGTTEK